MVLFVKNLIAGHMKYHFIMVCVVLWVFSQLNVAFSATKSVLNDAGFVEGDVRNFKRDPDPVTFLPVKDRVFTGFVPKGVIVGNLLLLPTISVQTRYNDNLFATKDGKIDDVIIITTPSISGHTENTKHFFGFKITGNVARYLENESENYDDFNINSNGYFELRHDLLLPWSGSFRRFRQDREDNLSRVFTKEPQNIYESKFDLGFDYKPNRVGFKVLGRHIRKTFEDGVSLSNQLVSIVRSDADFKTNEIEAEASYELMANHHVFVRGNLGKTKYDSGIFDNSTGVFTNVKRDSSNILALIGVRSEYKGLIVSDIGIGYTSVDFETDTISDVENIAIEASVDWNVTKLSSLGLDLTRSVIQDNEIIQGIVQTYGRLSLDHELRRYLILNAYGTYINREFDGSSREDDVYRLGLGVVYTPSPYYSLKGEYVHNIQDSTISGNEFDSNLFMLRLTGRY